MPLCKKALVGLLVAFLVPGWVFCLSLRAQEATGNGVLEVIGTGKISRDDVARARDEAISQALWDIVEKGVEHVLSSTAVVANFQLLSDRVYSRPEEFIHDYKVLTESKSSREYRVVVQATLQTEVLQEKLRDIGVLVTAKEMPEILFLLSERPLGSTEFRHSWGQDPYTSVPPDTEEALAGHMRDKGFVIVKPGTLLADQTMAQDPDRNAGLAVKEAVALAKKAGADIVVTGQAVAQPTGNIFGTDMQSVEVTVALQAVKVEDGTVIGSFTATKAAVHTDALAAGKEAFTMAASSLAEELASAISASWTRETSRTILVDLVVQGISEYSDFIRFRKTLRNEVRGVKNVYLKAIKSGEAAMDVELQGNTRMLADELMLKGFEGFGVNIFDVGQNTIRLELVPRADEGTGVTTQRW